MHTEIYERHFFNLKFYICKSKIINVCKKVHVYERFNLCNTSN
jgi:hypothetical protein